MVNLKIDSSGTCNVKLGFHELIFLKDESDDDSKHEELVLKLIEYVLKKLQAKKIDRAPDNEILFSGDWVAFKIDSSELIVFNEAIWGSGLYSQDLELIKKIKTIVEEQLGHLSVFD